MCLVEVKWLLAKTVVVVVELREIVQALTLGRPVRALLTKKARAAAPDKNPLAYPLDKETETW